MTIEINDLVRTYENFREKFFNPKTGALIDKTLSSELKSQYHYGAFILSSVLVYNQTKNKACLSDIDSIFKFLVDNVNDEVVKVSLDFNIESLCLAHWRCLNESLKASLEEKIKYFSFYLNPNINAYANDYYLLRYFNINYVNKILGLKLMIPEKVKNTVTKLSSSSGILFDSYSQSGQGIPDLTYHCRNLQIFQMCALIFENDEFDNVVEKGIQFLINIFSKNLEIGGYGRTPESVYGYASLLLSLSPYNCKRAPLTFDDVLDKISKTFFVRKNFDINITFYEDENNLRCGYDTYVYPVVYKYYALSRLLLAVSINSDENKCIAFKPSVKGWFFDIESGFLRLSNHKINLILNLYGHYDSQLRARDRRYLPLVPCYFFNEFSYKMPQTPYSSVVKLPKTGLIKKILKKVLDFLEPKPTHTGFHPRFISLEGESLITKCKVIKSNTEETVLDVIEFENSKKWNKEKSSKVGIEGLSVKCYLRYADALSIRYELSKQSIIEYSIRLNDSDVYFFVGSKVYVNTHVFVKFNIPIKKVINEKIYKCVGGYVKIVTFAFIYRSKELEVDY